MTCRRSGESPIGRLNHLGFRNGGWKLHQFARNGERPLRRLFRFDTCNVEHQLTLVTSDVGQLSLLISPTLSQIFDFPKLLLRRQSGDSHIGCRIASPSATADGRLYQSFRNSGSSLHESFRNSGQEINPASDFPHLAKFLIFLLLCRRSGDSWVGSRITLPSATVDGKIVKPSAMTNEDFSNPSDL